LPRIVLPCCPDLPFRSAAPSMRRDFVISFSLDAACFPLSLLPPPPFPAFPRPCLIFYSRSLLTILNRYLEFQPRPSTSADARSSSSTVRALKVLVWCHRTVPTVPRVVPHGECGARFIILALFCCRSSWCCLFLPFVCFFLPCCCPADFSSRLKKNK